jgi:hypothetical protein
MVMEKQKIAAFGSSYRETRSPVGNAEGCDLLILLLIVPTLRVGMQPGMLRVP